ncbi:MAG: HD domain-containing protein [Thermodesulfobacteriota bacterium]|nr:HD domain-containing protein [Thermodesulfobacteriota bacterium]
MVTTVLRDILRFIAFFNASINNIRLYSAEHPQARRCLQTANTVLADLLQTRESITFIIIEDDLVVDETPVRSREPHPEQFVHILQKAGLERLTLLQGLEQEEFNKFILAFAAPEKPALETTGHIKVGHVSATGKDSGHDDTSTQEQAYIQKMQLARASGYEALEGILAAIKQHQKIDIHTINSEIAALAQSHAPAMNPLHLLMPLEAHSNYTARHMINVCLLTISQASALGFKRDHITKIGIAALLFDVGKLFIADAIITKPTALTPKERKVMEGHTVKGARYILSMAQVPKLAVLCALEHHRRFDGTGYPVLTKGWQPNIVSQMVAIADAFDAMRSQRPYQDPFPMEKIVRILKTERGSTFHPYLVDRFLQLVLR